MEPNFKFIGWCNEDGHDKVWTSFEINGSFFCAWGRRDKKLQFKRHTQLSLQRVENSKRYKYKEVDAFMLFAVFPYFKNQVSENLLTSMLTNKVR